VVRLLYDFEIGQKRLIYGAPVGQNLRRGFCRVSKPQEAGAQDSPPESSLTTDLEPARLAQRGKRGKQSKTLEPAVRPTIRVLVMSDHALTRDAFCALVRAQHDLLIVGEAQTNPADLAAIREKADVILIDLDSTRHQGFDFLSQITKEAQGARLIVMTEAPPSQIYQVIRLGVMGVVSKEKPASFLLKAIERVNVGEVWLDRSLMSLALRQVLFPNNGEGAAHEAQIATLTKREREVVALVGAGCTNEQIAVHLSITETTVRHHLTSIFDKLAVKGRFNLVFYAYKYGLASPPA